MKFTNGGMSRIYKIYTFLLYVLPMVILFVIKREDYTSDGSIFGFWGIIIVMLCVIMFKSFVVDFFKKYSILTVSIIVMIIGLFSRFLSTQLILIGVVSTIASILSLSVSVVADVYDKHAYKTVDGEKVVNKSPAISEKEAWKEAYGYNIAEDENE